MKKMTALVAFLTAVIFTSCSTNTTTKVQNPQPHEFTFTANCDTAIVVKVPIQSPIHTCSGTKSKYNKIVDWKDSTVYMHKGQTITLSNEYMNSQGWYWFPAGTTPTLPDNTAVTGSSNSSDDYGFPAWMKWIFWNLIVPALILLVAFLIGRELWRAINRNSTPNDQSGGNTAAAGNQNVTNPVQPVRQMTSLENNTTVINQMPESYRQGPLFNITNSGTGPLTVGNIHIHVDSDGDHNEKAEKPETKPAKEAE